MAHFWRYNRKCSSIRPRHWIFPAAWGFFIFTERRDAPHPGHGPTQNQKRSDVPAIKFIDLFSGVGGFREGLERAGGFACVGHCEIDQRANQSYNALFPTEGEWFCEDIRAADPAGLPDFDLLCGGFPCQSFSLAGKRRGFTEPRGTLFFEIARLVKARHPAYLLLENVPGLLSHDQGRTFAAILHTLDRLGYGVEWQVLNSKDFGVPQSRRRVYLVGYLDPRCARKVFPFTQTAGTALVQLRGGQQGKRIYSPEGVSCTLTAQAGGSGGTTGLYPVGLPSKEATRAGYKMAYPGDSVSLAYAAQNTHRGRVGRSIAHTVTTQGTQGVLEGQRIRRLTPRECFRLQGWTDDRIDPILHLHSDHQLYKQAGNGVTVPVVEAIGKRIAAMHREVTGSH